ncbi:MAG: DUF262 domain-containing protein [bacterium]|nr:DUF262 domain-containing protein [bacterium]
MPEERSFVTIPEEQAPLEGDDTSNDEVDIRSPFDPSQIRVDTKTPTLDVLIRRMKNEEIDMAPDFQRYGGVWRIEAESRLIESLLIKIPLPAFYFDASDDERWLVVDGLQRLTTIKKFVIDKSLQLKGLEFLHDYEGKCFDDLSRALQRRIEETSLVVYLIQPGTPHRVKFDIFKRINTGGQPLSAQEIRHALNQGKATVFLKELVEMDCFKQATAGSIPSKRMDDRECALRFLAFSMTSPEQYDEDNFDLFLHQAMSRLNESSDEDLAQLKTRFQLAMETAYKLFENDAFRKRFDWEAGRSQINKALFESWSVNLGALNSDEVKRLIERQNDLKRRFINLMHNKPFESAITQGTGSVKRVRMRFEQIGLIIQETLQ